MDEDTNKEKSALFRTEISLARWERLNERILHLEGAQLTPDDIHKLIDGSNIISIIRDGFWKYQTSHGKDHGNLKKSFDRLQDRDTEVRNMVRELKSDVREHMNILEMTVEKLIQFMLFVAGVFAGQGLDSAAETIKVLYALPEEDT